MVGKKYSDKFKHKQNFKKRKMIRKKQQNHQTNKKLKNTN